MVTRWTPVKNLTFSGEVGAFFLDQKFTGVGRFDCAGPEADREIRVQGPEHGLLERSRSAQLLIPKDLKHQGNPRQETAGGFSLSGLEC